jgi:small-conductance mechanosensitive channel
MKQWLEQWQELVLADTGSLWGTAFRIGVILFVAAFGWWLFNILVRKLEKRRKDRTPTDQDLVVYKLLRRAGHISILVLAGIGIIRIFQLPLVERVGYALMIILLSSLANSLIGGLIPYIENKIAEKTDTHVDDIVLGIFKRFSGIIIYTVGFVLALDVLGLNIMPFVAGASVAGVAIGFAAKDTLSNFIAGILLIIDRPFEVGDRIEIWSAPKNSATWGDVIDIGLRATKIKTTDNIVIVIPNNEIMKRDIINYTTVTDEIRVRVPIGIAYDANVNKAKELIKDVSLEMDWVMRDPAPQVVVKSFGESSVNLEARIWISQPRRRIHTISHVTDRVKEVFQEAGIEIPFPKRDITIKKEV